MTGLVLDPQQREVLDDLFDKWSLLILDVLCARAHRFSELRRALPSVTPKSMTGTLRRLERNGLIARQVTATSPVHVTYSVTPLGRSLADPLNQVLRWIVDNAADVRSRQTEYDGTPDANT